MDFLPIIVIVLLICAFVYVSHNKEEKHVEEKIEVDEMAELEKKLHYQTNSGASGEITLYSTASEAGENYINLQVDNSSAFAALGDATDSNASSLRIQKGNSTFAILTRKANTVNLRNCFFTEEYGWAAGLYQYYDEEAETDGLLYGNDSTSFYLIPKHPDCSKISIMAGDNYSSTPELKRTYSWSDILAYARQNGYNEDKVGIIVQTIKGFNENDEENYGDYVTYNFYISFLDGDVSQGENYLNFYMDETPSKWQSGWTAYAQVVDSLEEISWVIAQHN